MTKFYFHVRRGTIRFNDGVGVDLADLPQAWNHAVADARRFIEDDVLDGAIEDHWIEIGDETGAVVAYMPFGRSLRVH